MAPSRLGLAIILVETAHPQPLANRFLCAPMSSARVLLAMPMRKNDRR
jgi:hypothetical protein